MWQTTHISGWGYDDTEDENLIKVDTDVSGEDSERIMFKADGTYKWYWYSNYSGWQGSGSFKKYDITGSKIILYSSIGDIDETYSVISIKGDIVVIETSLDEGSEYKQRITCKRVE